MQNRRLMNLKWQILNVNNSSFNCRKLAQYLINSANCSTENTQQKHMICSVFFTTTRLHQTKKTCYAGSGNLFFACLPVTAIVVLTAGILPLAAEEKHLSGVVTSAPRLNFEPTESRAASVLNLMWLFLSNTFWFVNKVFPLTPFKKEDITFLAWRWRMFAWHNCESAVLSLCCSWIIITQGASSPNQLQQNYSRTLINSAQWQSFFQMN